METKPGIKADEQGIIEKDGIYYEVPLWQFNQYYTLED